MTAIRPMTVNDIPAALALWQEAEGMSLRSADRPEALARYLARNPGCSFVAIAADELAGVSLAGHDGRRGYLNHVAVRAGHRRQGFGRRLVAACLGALRADGIEKVTLFVKSDNAAGFAFWHALGGRRDDIVPLSIILSDDPNA
ncbi:MAG TPA: GNAT family N-acetyltransferase [Urbifossiella sp.]|jgi:ribosomal protein S18 acetylase RimI-like enzyme|nr:GNAT family N-acetyltransferase [Urbifossiella sp.]